MCGYKPDYKQSLASQVVELSIKYSVYERKLHGTIPADYVSGRDV